MSEISIVWSLCLWVLTPAGLELFERFHGDLDWGFWWFKNNHPTYSPPVVVTLFVVFVRKGLECSLGYPGTRLLTQGEFILLNETVCLLYLGRTLACLGLSWTNDRTQTLTSMCDFIQYQYHQFVPAVDAIRSTRVLNNVGVIA